MKFETVIQNNFPLQKLGENDKNNSGFPTVMIPGIGPCMMIPTALADGLKLNL